MIETTLKAKVIVVDEAHTQSDVWNGSYNLEMIKNLVDGIHCEIHWINSDLQPSSEPTIIIKI